MDAGEHANGDVVRRLYAARARDAHALALVHWSTMPPAPSDAFSGGGNDG